MVEQVHHPSHYGGSENPHETIKCLEAWGLEQHALLWNVVKYVSRAGKKGAKHVDLEKACWYLRREIAKAGCKDIVVKSAPVSFGKCPVCTAWTYVRSDGTLRAHDYLTLSEDQAPDICTGTGEVPCARGFVHGDESRAHKTIEETEQCTGCLPHYDCVTVMMSLLDDVEEHAREEGKDVGQEIVWCEHTLNMKGTIEEYLQSREFAHVEREE